MGTTYLYDAAQIPLVQPSAEVTCSSESMSYTSHLAITTPPGTGRYLLHNVATGLSECMLSAQHMTSAQ